MNSLFLIKRRSTQGNLFFLSVLLMLLFGWVIQLFQPGVTTIIFESIFLITSFICFLYRSSHKKSVIFLFLLISIYVLLSMFYALYFNNVNIFDFLIAYKFTWYILLLLPFSRVVLLDESSIYTILKITLVMFLLVYSGKFILGDDRPTFFIENNFEIMFLCFLFYANHIINRKTKMIEMLLLLLITVISGSRSGVVLALITVIFTTDLKHIIRSKNIFIPLAAFLGVLGAYVVYSSRTEGGLGSTDRYRFFQIFLESTSDWSGWQFFLGAPRITKLPDFACAQLSFYKSLLSFDGDDSCYSVIFHSFNMRILYDHGLIVIIALILILNRILENRTYKDKFLVFSLLFINGMSVSSINSVYAALGIALIASIPKMYKKNERF